MPQFRDWDTTDPWERRDRYVPPPPSDAPPAAPDIPPAGTEEGWLPDYEGPMSPSFRFPGVPGFDAPDFDVPSYEDALNEPGYQFRLGAGRGALENSAAARGTLRTGGTLKDILEYGQNFGAAEYSNVFNRALQTYGAKLQGAEAEYAPQIEQYRMRFGAEQARGLAEFQRWWDRYMAELDRKKYEDAVLRGILTEPPPTPPGG